MSFRLPHQSVMRHVVSCPDCGFSFNTEDEAGAMALRKCKDGKYFQCPVEKCNLRIGWGRFLFLNNEKHSTQADLSGEDLLN